MLRLPASDYEVLSHDCVLIPCCREKDLFRFTKIKRAKIPQVCLQFIVISACSLRNLGC